MIAYVSAYSQFRHSGRASLDAVQSLVLQQIICGYALISATAPTSAKVLEKFRTDQLGCTDSSRSRSRVTGEETFGLQPLSSKQPTPDWSSDRDLLEVESQAHV